jgi:hypothetical protein
MSIFDDVPSDVIEAAQLTDGSAQCRDFGRAALAFSDYSARVLAPCSESIRAYGSIARPISH